MHKIVFFIMLLTLTACDKSSNSTSDTSVNAAGIVGGKTYYYGVQKSNGDKIIDVATFSSSNTIKAMTILWKTNGNLIYRKSIGSYVVSGEMYNFTYTYETCNPVHNESITIHDGGNGLVSVKIGSSPTQYIYRDAAIYTIPGLSFDNVGSMTEDINCNLIAKSDIQEAKSGRLAEIQPGAERKPASIK